MYNRVEIIMSELPCLPGNIVLVLPEHCPVGIPLSHSAGVGHDCLFRFDPVVGAQEGAAVVVLLLQCVLLEHDWCTAVEGESGEAADHRIEVKEVYSVIDLGRLLDFTLDDSVVALFCK